MTEAASVTFFALLAIFPAVAWLIGSTVMVLVGGELNAEMEYQTERDTTNGPELPPGSRGTIKADWVA